MIDLIVTWPTHLDYPLFRQLIKKDRKQFNKVFVVFTEMNAGTADYKQYIKEAMAKDRVTFVEPEPSKAGSDWRNVAINSALPLSDSEWIYFCEQDFIPAEGFWREVHDLQTRVDVFGHYQGDRLHPCCLFIKRELLDRTKKDFGADPDNGFDHFGKLQRDLGKQNCIIGVVKSNLGHHMNGLSQNLFMLQKGEEPNYKPPEFEEYCNECLYLDMPPDLRELMEWYISK